jgi:hypothetical protein
MVRLALLPAAFLLALGAGHPGPPMSAAPLIARAGIGGIARPGRWLPVEVTINGETDGHHGVLRVEWGDAVALRDIDIPGGATEQITILLRAIAAGPTVHVTRTDDRSSASIDAPVELASLDEALTLCIGDAAPANCTVRVAEDAAPSTWRGFDAADVVVWPGAAQSAHRDAARALATWRAMRWLGDEGPADPVLPPFDAATPAVSSAAMRVMILALAAVLLTTALARLRVRVALAIGVPLSISVAAGAFMANPSRLAPSAATAIQLTGIVHQFADTPQSTFSAKAEIEQSNAAELVLHPSLADVTMATAGSDEIRSISRDDHDGRAVYHATSGLGARRRVTLDGSIDAEWLSVAATGSVRTIANRAPFALGNCRWRGTSTQSIGTLLPGGSVGLDQAHTPVAGDTIVCALPNDWLGWTTSDARVDVRGGAHLVYHFWPAPHADESHAAR